MAATSVTPAGSSGAVEYGSATPTGFAAETTGSSLDGQFVMINNTPFAPALSGFDGNGGWNTSAGFVVGNRIIGTLPNCGGGFVLGLAGVADLVSTDLVLLPRSNADITCIRFVPDITQPCVGQTNTPIGSVALGYATGNDRPVSMVSSDPSTLSVSDTTVLTGQTSASVLGTAIQAGTVNVTATINGISSTHSVDVSASC
jgi:hypothetical protein